MDKYKTTFGTVLDLDDTNIYPEGQEEKTSYELWLEARELAGSSLFYMQYLHPEINWEPQRTRVDYLCKELAFIRVSMIKDSPENRLKMMKWMLKFEDEVENQV